MGLEELLHDENILKTIFQKVKRKYRTQLNHVEYSQESETAIFHLETHEISVNPEFIKKIITDAKEKKELIKIVREYAETQNINYKDINELLHKIMLEGILTHEVSHHVNHPHSLRTRLLQMKVVNDDPTETFLMGYYDDVKANIQSIMIQGDRTIPFIYSAIGPSNELQKIIIALQQEQTQVDFGMHAAMSDKAWEALDKLVGLYYFRAKEELNMRTLRLFIQILKPFYNQKQCQKGGIGILINQRGYLDGYTEKEIERTLKRLIREGKISKNELPDLIKKIDKVIKADGGFLGGPEGKSLEVMADMMFYKNISNQYSIKIIGTPITDNDNVYPSRHKKYETGDNPLRLDVWNSFGKIIPGISQTWIDDKYKTFGEKKEIPNLVLILDSSGSMPNPTTQESHAVIASFVAARSYLRNRAEVAVANFSGYTIVSDFSRNEDEILSNLLLYQGDGTFLKMDKILKVVGEKKSDYIVITDTELYNLDEAFSKLEEIAKKGSRVFVFWTSNQPNLQYRNIQFIKTNKTEDLANIVLRSIDLTK